MSVAFVMRDGPLTFHLNSQLYISQKNETGMESLFDPNNVEAGDSISGRRQRRVVLYSYPHCKLVMKC